MRALVIGMLASVIITGNVLADEIRRIEGCPTVIHASLYDIQVMPQQKFAGSLDYERSLDSLSRIQNVELTFALVERLSARCAYRAIQGASSYPKASAMIYIKHGGYEGPIDNITLAIRFQHGRSMFGVFAGVREVGSHVLRVAETARRVIFTFIPSANPSNAIQARLGMSKASFGAN